MNCDLDVAYNFTYTLLPGSVHKELDSFRDRIKKDPADLFFVLHKHVTDILIKTGAPRSALDLVCASFTWGIAAMAASKNETVIAASKTTKVIVDAVHKTQQEQVNQIMNSIEEAVKAGIKEGAEKAKSEPSPAGDNVVIGKFKSENN